MPLSAQDNLLGVDKAGTIYARLLCFVTLIG